ncbi:MAG TPA: 3-isopropylmalate dehydrogenase [Solirubrobacterales bacterium]|nr:3-isopropylmalate dehydrogenase [Solirubrobacterales bacterium]
MADESPVIVVLPGDGIGPEVTAAALQVSEAAAGRAGLKLRTEEFPAGSTAIEACGQALPAEALEAARRADAILFGAVGSPEPPPAGAPRPEEAVLGLRVELDIYANLRPALARPELAGSAALRPELLAGTDILLVRESVDGPFFAEPRGLSVRDGVREGIDTWHYDEPTIARVVGKACDLAGGRRGHVTSVDKANVLQTSALWREVAHGVGDSRTEVEVQHMLVDNAAAQLVTEPSQFDVIVTENLFGDILSDLFAALVGSLGMLPSATVGDDVGLFEPVHGSAPDIAGRGIANPYAAIASASLMFRLGLGRPEVADAIDAALDAVLASGARTADVAGADTEPLGTTEFTERVLAALEDPIAGAAR